MNLDDLKTTWKEYDRKVESSREINARILQMMVKDRSDNRFTSLKRYYQFGMLWMFVCISAGLLVMAGNPFDYRHELQYTPIVIFTGGLMILLTDFVRTYASLQRISFTQYNVGESLKRIIGVYEKPKRFLRYTIIIFLFSQVVLLPLSFLPPTVERIGLGPALLSGLVFIAAGTIVLFVAARMGLFRARRADKFKDDLDELESLKRISAELRTGENG